MVSPRTKASGLVKASLRRRHRQGPRASREVAEGVDISDTYPSAHGKIPSRDAACRLVVAAGDGGGSGPGTPSPGSGRPGPEWFPAPHRRRSRCGRPCRSGGRGARRPGRPGPAVWPTAHRPTMPGSFTGTVYTPPCGRVARATVWATRSDQRYEAYGPWTPKPLIEVTTRAGRARRQPARSRPKASRPPNPETFDDQVRRFQQLVQGGLVRCGRIDHDAALVGVEMGEGPGPGAPGSPAGGSTLTTSAPRSANTLPQYAGFLREFRRLESHSTVDTRMSTIPSVAWSRPVSHASGGRSNPGATMPPHQAHAVLSCTQRLSKGAKVCPRRVGRGTFHPGRIDRWLFWPENSTTGCSMPTTTTTSRSTCSAAI